MANATVNKVVLGSETLIDLTADTVDAAKMLSGVTAHDKSGKKVTGSIASKSSSDMITSGPTITAPAGYYSSNSSKSVASGSATTPATTITKNPTISWDSANKLIKATYSGSQSVTPSVSAGYVSSGTSGTISVSGNASVSPATLEPNLTAENIKKDVVIFGIVGTQSGLPDYKYVVSTGLLFLDKATVSSNEISVQGSSISGTTLIIP